MKIRNGFVANSSSSSFIVAKKDTCTYDEILETIKNQDVKIRKILEQNRSWIKAEDERLETELENGNIEKALELAIKEIAEELYYFKSDTNITLGEWNVYAQEIDSEEGIMFNIIMLEIGTLFTSENMRIG